MVLNEKTREFFWLTGSSAEVWQRCIDGGVFHDDTVLLVGKAASSGTQVHDTARTIEELQDLGLIARFLLPNGRD